MNERILVILMLIIMMAVAIPFIARSLLWNRVLKQLHKGNYERVLTKLQGKAYTLFFSEYDRHYNCLRVYLAKSDNKNIEMQTNTLLAMKLSEQQAYQVASQTYFYFLEKENKEICTKLLAYMEKKADGETILYNQMLFRVLIEKKYEDIKHIEDLLLKIEDKKVKKDQVQEQKVQVGLLQYLLGVQYSYKGDSKEKTFYLNKAKVNLKGTPYHKKIKQLL